MAELRSWPRRLLDSATENPLIKAGSLFVAILAWLYVQGGQVTEVKVRATVDWNRILPPGLATAEPLPQTVALSVKGSRSATRRAQRGEVSLTADLTKLKAGEHEIETASLEVRGMPPGVSVIGFVPPNVHLVLDEEIPRKVRVKPVTVGEPAEGFIVEKLAIEPTVVEVRGPRVVLSDLFEVPTHPIDVSRLTADLEEPVELDLPFAVERASGPEVRVRVDIEPVVERRSFDDVRLAVMDPAYKTTIQSVDLVLQGPAAAVRAISSDDVAALILLPEEAKATTFEVGYGPKDGARINIVYPSRDEVRVLSVKPPIVEVTRQ